MIVRALYLALATCFVTGISWAQEDSSVESSRFGAYLGGVIAADRGDIAAAARFYGNVLEREQNDPRIAFAAMQAFAEYGQMERAVGLADRLLQEDRGGLSARLVALAGAVAEGHWEYAGRIRSLLLAGDVSSSSMILDAFLLPALSAWIAAGAGNPEIGLPALEELAQRGSLAPLHDYHAGLILRLRHETSRAGLHFARAATTRARPARVSLAIAAHYRETGRNEKATSILHEISVTNPRSGLGLAIAEGNLTPEALAPGITDARKGIAEVFHDGARILLRDGFHRPAFLQVRLALYLRPDFPAAQLLLGQVLEASGATKEAISAFRSVPELAPESWDAGVLFANLLADRGLLDEGERALRQLAARHAGRTGALDALGRILSNAGRYEESVDAFTEAIGRAGEPARQEHWPLFYGRAFALDQSRQWPRAEQDLHRALELQPGQPLVLNYLAYSWIERGERLETARNMVEQAAAQRPRNGAIIDSLGWAQYHLGEFDAAVETLERALAVQPGDPVIIDHYGDALWRSGRHMEARFQWRILLRSKPEEELVREIERKLEHGLDPLPQPAEEKEI